MSIIDKKEVEHLAELARIEITSDKRQTTNDKEKIIDELAADLGKILKHFEELKEVDTEGVRPMDGGTFEENVVREDEIRDPEPLRYGAGKKQEIRDKLAEAFPEKKDGFLKVPPVF